MRLVCAFVAFAVLSCGTRSAVFVFPQTAGDWTLDSSAGGAAAASSGSGWQGVYVDSNKAMLTVRVELMGPSAAFERVQKSRPEPGMIFFHYESYFITVRGDAPNEALNRFAAAFEKQLRSPAG